MERSSLVIAPVALWTGDRARPRGEAILIEEGTVAAVGSLEEVRRHAASRRALWVDGGGATLLPGLTDAHLHLTALSRQRRALSLFEAPSRESLLEKVRERAREIGPGEWIYGVRFDNARWPDSRLPTREELDALRLPNPVLLLRVCAHIHVANGRALEEGGLGAPGRFDDGLLLEDQARPVVEAMKRANPGGKAEAKAIGETMAALAAEGITSVHSCNAASYGLEENLEAYRLLRSRRALPLRICYYSDEPPRGWSKSGDGDEWLRYGGRKFFLDGSLGARTAAMTFPYEDDKATRGRLNWDDEAFRAALGEASAAGLQAQVHAIGDAAIDQFLSALEALGPEGALPGGLHHRLVHVQICREDQRERLRRLDVVCDVQPVFVPSDLAITASRIGESRLPWAYGWKSLLRRGLLLTGSSDAPVEPTNPWRGIWAAVARVDDEGLPRGGWLPEQKLDLDEALELFTVNPARAVGLHHRLGSLRPGMAADLVLLDRDIHRAPEEALKEVRPRLTFVGGRLSHGSLPGWECLPSPGGR
ncbi:amidohydrolase [Aminirod propionatiphilus]|uniref:Amidohydrolase n=1 Tax=Aminirod propionatiphilus TaxID=3415223 RepID=A0ACD1DUG0_9BACT|nr:amidohydrolase [Synergistota bacterium]